MRLGIALGFGWLCGAYSERWLEFPWGLVFAVVAGVVFGAAVAVFDRIRLTREQGAE